jgi:hypothetical protein
MYSKNKNIEIVRKLREEGIHHHKEMTYHIREYYAALKEAEIQLQRCSHHASLIKEISKRLEEAKYA